LWCANAVSFAPAVVHGARRWIVDSGAGNDLINRESLTDASHLVYKDKEPLRLWTAAGIRLAKDRIAARLDKIGYDFHPIVLPGSPDALSLGRMCALHGYRFIWEPYAQEPILISPNGKSQTLYTEHFVAYLDEYVFWSRFIHRIRCCGFQTIGRIEHTRARGSG
jgi:hypothetical protein